MSIREQYDKHGVLGYYAEFADTYVNPHESLVTTLLKRVYDERWTTGIDFSCGAGLVTNVLRQIDFVGVDPFMADRYERETGRPCLRGGVEQVVNGEIQLPVSDVIICSYAIDLFPKSYMTTLLWLMAEAAQTLVIIRPNKKAIEHPAWTAQFRDQYFKAHTVVYIKAG